MSIINFLHQREIGLKYQPKIFIIELSSDLKKSILSYYEHSLYINNLIIHKEADILYICDRLNKYVNGLKKEGYIVITRLDRLKPSSLLLLFE
jgi:hypothetical protein